MSPADDRSTRQALVEIREPRRVRHQAARSPRRRLDRLATTVRHESYQVRVRRRRARRRSGWSDRGRLRAPPARSRRRTSEAPACSAWTTERRELTPVGQPKAATRGARADDGDADEASSRSKLTGAASPRTRRRARLEGRAAESGVPRRGRGRSTTLTATSRRPDRDDLVVILTAEQWEQVLQRHGPPQDGSFDHYEELLTASEGPERFLRVLGRRPVVLDTGEASAGDGSPPVDPGDQAPSRRGRGDGHEVRLVRVPTRRRGRRAPRVGVEPTSLVLIQSQAGPAGRPTGECAAKPRARLGRGCQSPAARKAAACIPGPAPMRRRLSYVRSVWRSEPTRSSRHLHTDPGDP